MAPRWRGVRHVLAVRLDNLGDVLMTSPALAAIKHGLPGSRLTLLGSRAGAAAAAHLPVVDDVIEHRAPWVTSGAPAGPDGELGQPERELLDEIAERRFDAAIVFTVCTQSALPAALFCLLAGIPLRLAHSRENPYRLLTDWVRDSEQPGKGMRHEVQRQLDLVACVGLRPSDDRLLFRCASGDAPRARARLSAAGIDATQPYVVVHPGASAPSRRWPAERFGVVAEAIERVAGCRVVFTGSEQEGALIEQARGVMHRPAVSLAGALSLGELGALIAGARLLVANNTGPVHMAAALGTPVVDLYALTNPQHTPWRVAARVLSHDVPCRDCLKSVCPEGHNDCLRRIEPEAVVGAALELMGLAGPRCDRGPMKLDPALAAG